MTERISGPRTVFKNWEVRSGRWTGISYFWHFSFDSHSFKRLKTFLKKVSFPKQHKDSERWKVVIPQRSHSLKTSYYYTSSSETWLSDEHPYTYIKWDEQQVRSLEKKGMKDRHTDMYGHTVQAAPTSCSYKFYIFKMAAPLLSKSVPVVITPPPTSITQQPLCTCLCKSKRKKDGRQWSHPRSACGLMRQMTGLQYTKGLDRLGSTGLLGKRRPSVGLWGLAGVSQVVTVRAFQAEGAVPVEAWGCAVKQGNEAFRLRQACQDGNRGRSSKWYCMSTLSLLGEEGTGGNGSPPQYSCPENPMDRKAWRATVQSHQESDTT